MRPKCHLLFSVFFYHKSLSSISKLMVSIPCVLPLVFFSFYFSFSFPLLIKLCLYNSLEIHAGDTWLVCKLSRVTDERNLGTLCLLIPSTKILPKCCSFAHQLLKLGSHTWSNKIIDILQGKPKSRKSFDLMERIIIDSCPLEQILKANKIQYFQ